MNAFAERGTRFATDISQASWTLPSVSSLFLSQYVSTHGIEHPTTRIPSEAETLAAMMAAGGYTNLASVMGRSTSADFGMDHRFAEFSTGDGYAQRKFRKLLSWIDGINGPFFAYVHLSDVHHPYTIPNPGGTSFGAGYLGTITGSSPLGARHAAEYSETDIQHLMNLYDDEVVSVDRTFGHLIRELRRRGLLDGTIIVVTADHGEAFGEHGSLGHRGPPYDEQIRVPLLMADPGVPTGRTVKAVVEAVDLAPTILDLVGLERGAAMQEESLVPLFDGPEPEESVGFAESIVLGYAAIRTPRWKLLVETGSDKHRLFDLVADPGETRDVAADHPEVLAELEARYRAFRNANEAATRFPAAGANVRDETEARLRALGYVE